MAAVPALAKDQSRVIPVEDVTNRLMFVWRCFVVTLPDSHPDPVPGLDRPARRSRLLVSNPPQPSLVRSLRRLCTCGHLVGLHIFLEPSPQICLARTGPVRPLWIRYLPGHNRGDEVCSTLDKSRR